MLYGQKISLFAPPVIGAAAGALAVTLGDAGPIAGFLLPSLGAAIGVIGFSKKPDPQPKPEPAPPPPVNDRTDREALYELPAAVILIDRDQRVRRINRAALDLIGAKSPGPLGGALVSVIRAPGLIEAVEDALEDRIPRAIPFTLMRARSELELKAHIHTLPSAGPRDPAALVMIEDQTRMRQMEEMRQNFIANASHELKTPLASIIGFIETLQGPAKDDEAAQVRFLDIMSTQAARMQRLVEDLMSLSRIEMNQFVRPTEPVNLGALAIATAAAMEPVAAEAGAELIVDTVETGPITTGDNDQLSQLLTNLIDNAIKYGGKGVTVTISEAPPAAEWPGMVGLVIADTGPGIPREHIPRLTQRFYRVSAARSRAVGGTGLGLAIAKHILQRHRGEIRIRSQLGEGSAFTIWLPKREESGRAQ